MLQRTVTVLLFLVIWTTALTLTPDLVTTIDKASIGDLSSQSVASSSLKLNELISTPSCTPADEGTIIRVKDMGVLICSDSEWASIWQKDDSVSQFIGRSTNTTFLEAGFSSFDSYHENLFGNYVAQKVIVNGPSITVATPGIYMVSATTTTVSTTPASVFLVSGGTRIAEHFLAVTSFPNAQTLIGSRATLFEIPEGAAEADRTFRFDLSDASSMVELDVSILFLRELPGSLPRDFASFGAFLDGSSISTYIVQVPSSASLYGQFIDYTLESDGASPHYFGGVGLCVGAAKFGAGRNLMDIHNINAATKREVLDFKTAVADTVIGFSSLQSADAGQVYKLSRFDDSSSYFHGERATMEGGCVLLDHEPKLGTFASVEFHPNECGSYPCPTTSFSTLHRNDLFDTDGVATVSEEGVYLAIVYCSLTGPLNMRGTYLSLTSGGVEKVVTMTAWSPSSTLSENIVSQTGLYLKKGDKIKAVADGMGFRVTLFKLP